MKSRLRKVLIRGQDITYDALLFACPGCIAGGPDGYDGIHLLPVNVKQDIGKPAWSWDGNLEAPTLSPSILTHGSGVMPTCHSFSRRVCLNFFLILRTLLLGRKFLFQTYQSGQKN